MTANTNPIFSRQALIGFSPALINGAGDYTGQNANNVLVFSADPTNGSFVQRLRFKSLGANPNTVARVYLNNGGRPTATNISVVSGTPTGSASATGGTLPTGLYYAKVYAVDQYGGTTAASSETAGISVAGPTGSLTWTWGAVTGAVKYVIAVGTASGAELVQFTATTNNFIQTTPGLPGSLLLGPLAGNNTLFDEISLPVTSVSTNTAYASLDVPMNIALPAGWNILVGLGATVTNGWQVTAIGGSY